MHESSTAGRGVEVREASGEPHLEPGKRWEDGFADGLFGAVACVPMRSEAALAPFSRLSADSANDNVLLEYRGALLSSPPVTASSSKAVAG